MIGVWINCATVVIGGILGTLLRGGIQERYRKAIHAGLALCVMLIGVSGVGPKAALAILSANTPEGLAMAIVTEDAKSLTAAQGIGKKIAQRIILELKDKMAKETASGLDFSGGKGAAVPAVFTSKATEAAAALAVLGYSTQEVQMALKGVDVETLPLEDYRGVCGLFGEDVYDAISLERCASMRRVYGGPAPENVREQTARIRALLETL